MASDCCQITRLRGVSVWEDVTARSECQHGVPQGSILGPVFFLTTNCIADSVQLPVETLPIMFLRCTSGSTCQYLGIWVWWWCYINDLACKLFNTGSPAISKKRVVEAVFQLWITAAITSVLKPPAPRPITLLSASLTVIVMALIITYCVIKCSPAERRNKRWYLVIFRASDEKLLPHI